MMTANQPKKWTTASLGEVAKIERTGVVPEQIGTGTTYVGLENIESGGRFVGVGPVKNGELASTKFSFSPRHVLYGKLRPYLAKIVCPDFEGVCSTDILPILPGAKLDRRYLCYFLRQPSMVEYATSRCTGANLPRLSPSTLEEFLIPLPPLPEQRRIADILDKADAIRRKRREALRITCLLPLSSFTKIFKSYLEPAKFKAVLKDVAEVVSGVAKGRRINSDDIREVPYLRVANVQAGYLDLSELKMIPATRAEVDSLSLRVGDIVMTEGGDYDKLGRGALWSKEVADCIHQNHVFRVRLNSDHLLPEVFVHFLQTQSAKGYFLRCAKKTTNLASINMTQLRSLPVPLPPLELQAQFVAELRLMDHISRLQHLAAEESSENFTALVQRAFRGEL